MNTQRLVVTREEVSNILLDTIHQYLQHKKWHDAVEFGLNKLKELGVEVAK